MSPGMAPIVHKNENVPEEPEVIVSSAPESTREVKDQLFVAVNHFRALILTSPLWLALFTVLLGHFGGQRIRDVVQFLTAPPR